MMVLAKDSETKSLVRWIQNILNKIKYVGIPKGYRGYPIEKIEKALKNYNSKRSVF